VAATLQAITPIAAAATQPQATQAAPTPLPPTETAQPSGIPVSFQNISLVIPNGLADGALTETVPEVTDQTGAPWEVAPAYLRFTLQNYLLQGSMFQPQIMVYPASDYASVSNGAAISIQRLQAVLAGPSAAFTNEDLPHLPFANADQMIGAQIKVFSFQSGSGVRVLAQYGQAVIPINNQEIFYHFEGLTSDGKSYIVATLPVNVSFLASTDDPNAVLPADGVPLPDMTSGTASDFDAYFKAVTDKMNSAPSDSFDPPLASLDSLMQSITVTP